MHEDLKARLDAAVAGIVSSGADKKLVVAGPGAGKTFLFRKLLEALEAEPDDALVLTFINNLKDDLARDLAGKAQVYTFHGYCRRLLHQNANLRGDLTDGFTYYPSLPSLIRADWEATRDEAAPRFIGLMRDVNEGEGTAFYVARSNYYDAVSFDDSVFRAYKGLIEHDEDLDEYELVLVDEYQDFNRLEVEFLKQIATMSPIVVAGDDDQALYSQLRSSSPIYIRELHAGAEYQNFELPFCMRCTAPVIGAVSDVLQRAMGAGKLVGRIQKPYEFYPPKKQHDTDAYPRIKVVETTVQRGGTGGANYFGRYIASEIAKIPAAEITEAQEENFPGVLVIGPQQYLRQVREYLEGAGYQCESGRDEDPIEVNREDGLRILKANGNSNLGWRILLEVDHPPFAQESIRRSVLENAPLVELLEAEYKDQVLAEAAGLGEDEEAGRC